MRGPSAPGRYTKAKVASTPAKVASAAMGTHRRRGTTDAEGRGGRLRRSVGGELTSGSSVVCGSRSVARGLVGLGPSFASRVSKTTSAGSVSACSAEKAWMASASSAVVW